MLLCVDVAQKIHFSSVKKNFSTHTQTHLTKMELKIYALHKFKLNAKTLPAHVEFGNCNSKLFAFGQCDHQWFLIDVCSFVEIINFFDDK